MRSPRPRHGLGRAAVSWMLKVTSRRLRQALPAPPGPGSGWSRSPGPPPARRQKLACAHNRPACGAAPAVPRRRWRWRSPCRASAPPRRRRWESRPAPRGWMSRAEVVGDGARRGGRAVHAGQHADVVARGHAAVARTMPWKVAGVGFEGRGRRARPGSCARAKSLKARLCVCTCWPGAMSLRGAADDLVVAPHRWPAAMARVAILWPGGTRPATVMPSSAITVPPSSCRRAMTTLSCAARPAPGSTAASCRPPSGTPRIGFTPMPTPGGVPVVSTSPGSAS
jgi:hypothetical protein